MKIDTLSYPVRISLALLLLIILSGFVISGLQQVIVNTQSDALDQGAYLSMGLAVSEKHQLTDPLRQPLYSWLLAPFARRELGYFTWAKLLTLIMGVVGVTGCYAVSMKLYRSPTLALLSAFLLATNIYYIQESATVMVEPLLAFMLLLVWFAGIRALESPRWSYWAVGGILTGLAYLAKETAMFWLPAWAAGAFAVHKLKLAAYNKFLVFLLLFMLVMSPVFINNYIRYGHLIFTDNISTVWLDDWEDFFAIGPDAQISLQDYLETHSLIDIANRLANGVLMMGAMSLAVFAPFQIDQRLLGDWGGPFGPLIIATVISILLACAYRSVLVSYCRRKASVVVFTLTFVALYVVGASWYVPVTFDPRYVVPLLPVGYVIAGGMIGRLWQHLSLRQTRLASLSGPAAVILLGAVILAWAAGAAHACDTSHCLTNPFESDARENKVELAVLDNLRGVASGSVIVYQPSHGLPMWLVEGESPVIAVPSNVDWSQFVAYLREQDAEFLVMTPELYQRRQGLFRYFLYPAWSQGTDRNNIAPVHQDLQIRLLPAGWDLIYAAQGLPTPYYVFRVSAPQEIQGRIVAEAGDAEVALGHFDVAEERYRAAASELRKLTPCNDVCTQEKAKVLRNLGQISMLRNRPDDALNYFDEVCTLQTDSSWYHMLRADTLTVLTKWTGAAEEYQAALTAGGADWHNLHASLAWLEEQQEKPEEAIGGYRNALRISPGYAWGQALLAKSLASYGMADQAAILYQDLLQRDLSWPFLHQWLGDGLAKEAAAVPLRPAAAYPDGLRLNRSSVDDEDYLQDGRLKIALYWTPPPYAGRQYRLYGKLVNAVYTVWGEGQTELHRQGIPEGAWASEAELQDVLTLSIEPGTPPGSYDLALELRDVTQDKWLPASGQADLELGPVELPLRKVEPDQLHLMDGRTAVLGGRVEFLGFQLEGQAEPGHDFVLTLFWQALEHMDTRYTVFTHLTGPQGQVWAQKDNEPVDGFHPTTSWQAGEIVRDRYKLLVPPDAPAQDYILQAGLYDAQTGQRLPVAGEIASPSGDSLNLKQIELR